MKTLLAILAVVVTLSGIAEAHYNPKVGRFMSRDPIEEHGGLNTYSFVRNKPVNNWDKYGLQEEECEACAEKEFAIDADELGKKPDRQCSIDGIAIELTFDGWQLSGGDGFSTFAVSGRPIKEWTKTKETGGWIEGSISSITRKKFDYSVERQKIKGTGPTPEGDYWISTCETNSSKNAKRHMAANVVSQVAWGSYSWHLHPEPTNQMYGRDKMFIHGGSIPGSAGCIDVYGGGDEALFNEIQHVDKLSKDCCCYIPVKVKYAYKSVTHANSSMSTWEMGGLSTGGISAPWSPNWNVPKDKTK